MKRVGLYVRVSTQEQKLHGMSVDTQITALTAFCEEQGYQIYKIYNDAGISARKTYKRRPALLEMLSDCQEGLIDLVLFTRLDRFFRSVPDYYACVEQMAGVPWRAIWEDYETTTPDGVFKVNIMLSVAQSEADKTSARLKDAFAYKRARGDYIGKAPTGYLVKGRDLVVDPEKQAAVTAIFKTYLSSFSTTKAMEASAMCGMAIERSSLLKMLNNPAYSGTTAGGYKCYAYITPEEQEQIRQVKRARTTKKSLPDRTYLFTGICICGTCGYRMAAKLIPRTHADGTKVTYKKYVCDVRKGSARPPHHLQIVEPRLEEYLIRNLDNLLKDLAVKAEARRKDSADSQKRKKRLEGKLERLREIYIDGDMAKEEYQERKKAIEAELATIRIPKEAAMQLPGNWQETYKQLTEANRQIFWKKVIKEVIIRKGEDPEVIFL